MHIPPYLVFNNINTDQGQGIYIILSPGCDIWVIEACTVLLVTCATHLFLHHEKYVHSQSAHLPPPQCHKMLGTPGPHFYYDFGDPQRNSVFTIDTQRISGYNEFLDVNIAHNVRRSQWQIENSHRMHFDHGLVYFISAIFR